VLGPSAGSSQGRRRAVTVLGGFLGSGKTTLLRAELRRAGACGPAVILNDFGHTAVDDVLLAEQRGAPTVISGGCVCCTMRDELAAALRELLDAEQRGSADVADHIVIETSGLSDPAPIAFTLANDPVLKHHYQLSRICVTVDAVSGLSSARDHEVARRQLIAADDLVLTKTDLVEEPSAVEDLLVQLRGLNPSARLFVTAGGSVTRVVDPVPGQARAASVHEPPQDDQHLTDVRTLELATDDPLDWQAFTVWLTLLLHRRGADVLRVKGVLDIAGAGPVALNGVQHVVHDPEHMPAGTPAGTRLVLILRNLDPVVVERSFRVFQNIDRSENAQS
jgi:G3E family GTPase